MKPYLKYLGGKIEDWDEMIPKFVKVFPIDYKKALERIRISHSKESETLTLTEEVYDK